jgi:hypothetical protein
MKKCNICIFLVLLCLITGCNVKEQSIYYTQFNIEDKMAENRAVYTSETAQISLNYEDCKATIVNAESEFITCEAGKWQGTLKLLNREISYGGNDCLFTVPYSNYFVYTPVNPNQEDQYCFDIIGNERFCGISGKGIKQVTIFNVEQVEIMGDKNIELSIRGMLVCDDFVALNFDGLGTEKVDVQYTEKGAILRGVIGTCNITTFNKELIHISKILTGEAVEIDIVSQPGEILVTPIKG